MKITKEFLESHGFVLREPAFENIGLPYWVNNGVLLFFNKSQPFYSFYLGYGFMEVGKYYAATMRWIDKEEQLKAAYLGIIGKPLELKGLAYEKEKSK
jgi:hypothetical protein